MAITLQEIVDNHVGLWNKTVGIQIYRARSAYEDLLTQAENIIGQSLKAGNGVSVEQIQFLEALRSGVNRYGGEINIEESQTRLLGSPKKMGELRASMSQQGNAGIEEESLLAYLSDWEEQPFDTELQKSDIIEARPKGIFVPYNQELFRFGAVPGYSAMDSTETVSLDENQSRMLGMNSAGLIMSDLEFVCDYIEQDFQGLQEYEGVVLQGTEADNALGSLGLGSPLLTNKSSIAVMNNRQVFAFVQAYNGLISTYGTTDEDTFLGSFSPARLIVNLVEFKHIAREASVGPNNVTAAGLIQELNDTKYKSTGSKYGITAVREMGPEYALLVDMVASQLLKEVK